MLWANLFKEDEEVCQLHILGQLVFSSDDVADSFLDTSLHCMASMVMIVQWMNIMGFVLFCSNLFLQADLVSDIVQTPFAHPAASQSKHHLSETVQLRRD